LSEACDPKSPSNQYVLQFKEKTIQLLGHVCGVGASESGEFNFAAKSQEIREQLIETKDILDDGRVVPGIDPAIFEFLKNISIEQIDDFINEYTNFTNKNQNFLCDSALNFMDTLGFLTIGTTATELLDSIIDLLPDFVQLVERNVPVQMQQDISVDSDMWNLDRIDQINNNRDNKMFTPGLGNGVHIYVLDTGVNLNHVEFQGRLGNGFDAVNNGGDANDCQGHGTHCAGTAAGSSYGIAREATIHPVRVLGCDGSGSGAGVLAGMDWVTANAIQPAVASMSLGGGRSSASNAAIGRMYDAGIVVSVAAGNSNQDACNFSPASAEKAITVGSTTINDARSGFSNYGSCTNIFAPGSNIKSAWFQNPTDTSTISGTSMACPLVSGVMAVYRGLHPSATPQEVWTAVLSVAAADKLSDYCPGCNAPNNLLLQSRVPDGCDPTPQDANCVVSDWSEWNACDQPVCSAPGTQNRTRTIITEAVGCGRCPEANLLAQTRSCNTCPQPEPTAATTAVEGFQFKTLTLTPTSGTTYDSRSCDTRTLKYDTSGHSRITMGDDDTLTVALGSFPFFGQSKSEGTLCSNGFLFFSGSCDFNFNIASHFQSQRISFVGADLNPSAGGVITISPESLYSDRRIITFAAVPYFSNTASVTFQAEIITSGNEAGTVRITYGFLNPAHTRVTRVIGISSGGGTPDGYQSLVLPSGVPCQDGAPAPAPTPPAGCNPQSNVAMVGISTVSNQPQFNDTFGFIVGGTEATRGRFPYMVNLATRGGMVFCGGSLIAPNVVLSAAHCAGMATHVFIGRFDLAAGEQFERFSVAEIPHPDYNSETVENDIMLLRLSGSSSVRPVWLDTGSATDPEYGFETGDLLNVMGWGATQESGSGSNKLMEVGVNYVPRTTCNTAYGGAIVSGMLCAASPGRDSCQGDSGGPLIVKGVNNAIEDLQVGVVSFGVGCARPAFPGVYAAVRQYVPWIRTTMASFGATLPSPGSPPCTTQAPTEAPAPQSVPTAAAPTEPPAPQPVPTFAPTLATMSPTLATMSPTMATMSPTLATMSPTPGLPDSGGDLPEHLATPAMYFRPDNQGLSLTTLLKGKSFTYFPTVREDSSFTPWEYRITCVQDNINDWDTASFTTMRLNDDDSQPVFLANSFRWKNSDVDIIYIGSNGYITIGGRDRTYHGTIFNHFNMERISAAFTDLNPSGAGTVRSKDATTSAKNGFVTVWFENVRGFGSASELYSFQVKIFQSGKITIMYKELPATNAGSVMVGISTGSRPIAFDSFCSESSCNDFLNFADTSIACGAVPTLPAGAPPIAERVPSQEFGSGAFDLVGQRLVYAPLAPAGGVPNIGYTVACKQSIGNVLPGGTGGTTLILGDDDSKELFFADGKTFTFLGTTYSSVWVGSNGYLTFGASDTGYFGSLFNHYGSQRISGLFTDLNPPGSSSASFVKYEQKANELVITFSDIKEYGSSSVATFQYELFFDNGNQAQPFAISWTKMDLSQGVVVGVGAGSMYSFPPDSFRVYDLSAQGSECTAAQSSNPGESGLGSSIQSSFGVQSAMTETSLERGVSDFCPIGFTLSLTRAPKDASPPPPAATSAISSPPPVSAATDLRATPLLVAAMAALAALALAA